jgi:hypothetical protein
MFDQAPIQRDHRIPHALAIHLHPRHTSLAALRILDLDLVYRFTVMIAQVEALPPSGDDRIQLHVIPAHLQTQDLFNPGSVHQRRRTCIPRPTTLTDPPGQSVHVSCDHVGLKPIVFLDHARAQSG